MSCAWSLIAARASSRLLSSRWRRGIAPRLKYLLRRRRRKVAKVFWNFLKDDIEGEQDQDEDYCPVRWLADETGLVPGPEQSGFPPALRS